MFSEWSGAYYLLEFRAGQFCISMPPIIWAPWSLICTLFESSSDRFVRVVRMEPIKAGAAYWSLPSRTETSSCSRRGTMFSSCSSARMS